MALGFGHRAGEEFLADVSFTAGAQWAMLRRPTRKLPHLSSASITLKGELDAKVTI